MKKFLLFFVTFFTCVFACAGCHKTPPATTVPHGLVTGVDVYCQMPGRTVSRHYTSPEKINAVLTYVRLLRPIGPIPLPQQSHQAESYEIVVTLEDGSKRVHRQRADSFVSKDQSYWGAIDPKLGQQLPLLITHFPSDPDGKI